MNRLRVLGFALVLAMPAAGALAQPPPPYKPAPAAPRLTGQVAPPAATTSPKLPWERDVDRFFNPPPFDPARPGINKLYKDPTAKLYQDPMAKFYQDRMAKLGLPPNASHPGLAPPQVTPAAPPPPEFNRLDANRDGAISRNEYLAGRHRAPPITAGAGPSLREQALNGRANSRFRHSDRNGDGIVNPGEFSAQPNARF